MSWAKNTIKLGAAQSIFPQFDIKAETLGDTGKVVGYSAMVSDEEMTDTGLTSLCQRIVQKLYGE